MAHLKERVLELSIKQINEHTDITVKYEQHKEDVLFQDFLLPLNRRRRIAHQ